MPQQADPINNFSDKRKSYFDIVILKDGPNTKGRKNTLKIHQLSKMKSITQPDEPLLLEDDSESTIKE